MGPPNSDVHVPQTGGGFHSKSPRKRVKPCEAKSTQWFKPMTHLMVVGILGLLFVTSYNHQPKDPKAWDQKIPCPHPRDRRLPPWICGVVGLSLSALLHPSTAPPAPPKGVLVLPFDAPTSTVVEPAACILERLMHPGAQDIV